MDLQQRIDLLTELGKYCQADETAWRAAKQRAHLENGWFIPAFIDLATRQIAAQYLQKEKLQQWAHSYQIPEQNNAPKTVGLIMAGNIPLVGFHDFLSIFLSGHRQRIKPSSRDEILIRHIVDWMIARAPGVAGLVEFAERLNGSDAFIATGSNNSARYFDYYFGKYPHIIRRNRTSVALLNGHETTEDLGLLADDVYQYFGLGCRNVTKLFVPGNYDFEPLLGAFRRYDFLADLARYKHNYDYQLTVLILNKKYYMSNESILLAENTSPFSPISVLHYEYYAPGQSPAAALAGNEDIQCIVAQDRDFSPNTVQPSSGTNSVPFGKAQHPALSDYADGVDTLLFLRNL